MDIICSTDNNYVQHCAVMLVSFFENNKSSLDNPHTIHLLTEGINEKNKKILQNLVASYQGKLCYYLIDSPIIKQLPIKESDHLTIATYYRLFVANVLPHNLEKALYLDCDIIVKKSLTKLWSISLDNYPIAAMEEMGCSLPDVFQRLQYEKKYGYFNAGVLLINLKYWREHNLTQLFFQYISKFYDSIKAHDQDVLNGVLHKKYLPISFEWNSEEAFYHYNFIKKHWNEHGFRKKLRSPAIIHYTWKPKPWDANCHHPLRYDYFYYRNKISHLIDKIIHNKRTQIIDKIKFQLALTLKIKGRHFYKI